MMLKVLGIKNNTAFSVINMALKNISRKLKEYPWYADFAETKKMVERLAKQETNGKPVSAEDRKKIYAKLNSYVFHTNVLAGLEKSKVYDFNELKEKAKSTLLGEKVEKSFSMMIANLESLRNLQEENLPKINSKLGYGIKEKTGILFFTPEFRHYEIFRAFPLAYLVYPGWVLEGVCSLVIDKTKLNQEQQQELISKISKEKGLVPHEAQKSNKYLYIVFLPEIKFAINKIIILGKAYIPNNTKFQKERNDIRLIAKDLLLEIDSVSKVVNSLNYSLKVETKKLETLQASLNSPTVKLSSMVSEIADKQKTISKIKSSLKEAEINLAKLEEQKQELVEKVKLSNAKF